MKDPNKINVIDAEVVNGNKKKPIAGTNCNVSLTNFELRHCQIRVFRNPIVVKIKGTNQQVTIFR